MSVNGTIRMRESRQVIDALLRKRGVSDRLYYWQGRSLLLLVGSRQVEFRVPAGLTFYALNRLLDSIGSAIDDLERARASRGQLDIEDAIRAAERVSP